MVSISRLNIPVAVLILAVGCSREPAAVGELVVDIDKSNPERLMRFYAGALDGVAGDSVLATSGRQLALRADRVAKITGYHADLNGDGFLDWDELVMLVDATYNWGSRFPATLEALDRITSYRDTTVSFVVELRGTMTVAHRRIFVPRAALQAALLATDPSVPRIHYPVATTMVGEHWLDSELVETTAMIKRPDGFWDFVVYDEQGLLTDSTSTEPRALQSPTQCAGCHFGSRAFEPEKSFPAVPRPGPDGPRAFLSATPGVDADLVALFDEHRRRSDTVLGIYATLYVGSLRQDDLAGRLGPQGAAILNHLFPRIQ
jgi:hypothetical protein